MAKTRIAARADGMRSIENAVFRAIISRGVDLKDHYFSWNRGSSPIMHADVQQLSLHLRDGRVLIQSFSTDEVERAGDGVTDVATLKRVHSIALTISPTIELPNAP
jgi:hypothetical protein